MPFSSSTHSIPLSAILIDREQRQRRALETDDLRDSIAKRGLINPIIVEPLFNADGTPDGRYRLIAGERRLTATRELGHSEILCRFIEDLDPVELQIVELEENIKRRDLDWQDQALAVARIHRLYRQQDPDWTAAETSAAIGLHPSNVSRLLRVAQEIEGGNAKVEEATSYAKAANMLARKDQREAAKALQELIQATPAEVPALGRPLAPVPPPPADEVLNLSFLDWAPSYQGPKFNLIHCDFPYGVNLFAGSQGREGQEVIYDDTPDIYFALLECLCKNLDNFCSISAHFIFWFSMKHYEATKRMLRDYAPSIEWSPHLIVWGKTDNSGIIGDARRSLRHTHETALFGCRGSRHVVQSVGDFYGAPTDRTLHPSAKPEPMLRHFFRAVVDEHTALLDPTCGAGSSLRAAHSLGADRLLGLELDPKHAETAQVALANAKFTAAASQRLADAEPLLL